MGSPLTMVREREKRVGATRTTKGGREGGRREGRTIFTERLKNRGKN